MLMQQGREYQCLICELLVAICKCCDRGNVYCSLFCSIIARKESQRKASATYQKTPAGKKNHAKRQREYMQRKKERKAEEKIMTHQGSQIQITPANCELMSSVTPENTNELPKRISCCHFCDKTVVIVADHDHFSTFMNFQSVFNGKG